MAIDALRCKECGTEYEAEARYVCERCFGPLEVTYRYRPIDDVGAARRRIQGGPQNVWRYAEFLPLDAQPGPSIRLTSDPCAALPPGTAAEERRGLSGQKRRRDWQRLQPLSAEALCAETIYPWEGREQTGGKLLLVEIHQAPP